MKPFVVRPLSCLKGEISLLGDKSIAHRSIIISALCQGITRIENFPTNKDCLLTLKAFKKLGIKITQGLLNTRKSCLTITVNGCGLLGFKKPKGPISVGDSGTTLRLLLGVLAGQDFKARLVAGESLSKRPMLRVTAPLRLMGAKIDARHRTTDDGRQEEYPPITIRGGNLKPITYTMPVASAQVKSAILLAALYAQGKTKVIEPISTRDHTERMLKLFKADIKVKHPPSLKLRRVVLRSLGEEGQNTIVINGNQELVSPKRIYIPQDISSASFFMVMATILPNSRILIKKVSLNPSRIGIIKVLKRMGAALKVSRCQSIKVSKFEPMGDIVVKSSFLKGTRVKKEEVPSLIDELPILIVAASVAGGKTILEGIGELRVKETDRVRSMTENLRKMGAKIEVFSATSRGGLAKFATKSGESAKQCGENFGGKVKVGKSEKIVIQGINQLKGARVSSFGDHRTAMSMVVAGLAAVGQTRIDDISCINKSFPGFLKVLNTLMNRRLTE